VPSEKQRKIHTGWEENDGALTLRPTTLQLRHITTQRLHPPNNTTQKHLDHMTLRTPYATSRDFRKEPWFKVDVLSLLVPDHGGGGWRK
jgi:hypothetical protein